MGGGSAQVNPPYQVSVAEGLAALLGDRLTVVDGVEVRTRPVPARDGFLTDPATGEPGIRVTLLDADGTVLEQRLCRDATTMVGMDDDFAGPVATARLTRRGSPPPARSSWASLGVGDWLVTVGGESFCVPRCGPPAAASARRSSPRRCAPTVVEVAAGDGAGRHGHAAPRATGIGHRPVRADRRTARRGRRST